MNINLFYILVIFIVINVRALCLMFHDKRMAIKNDGQTGKGRVSEVSLLATALFGGFVGIFSGIYLFRHKTNKVAFTWGVPLIILLNIVFFLLLKEKMTEDFGIYFYFNIPMM